MRKLLLLSLVLLCSLTAWTAQRSPEEAFSVARTFFMQSSAAVTRTAGDIQLVAVSNDLLESASTRGVGGTAFYVYNYAQSAYVIVSGDDRMKPILGYSDSGGFVTENLPVNILGWLELYNSVYAELANGGKAVAESKQLTTTSFPPSVAPLLGSICWDQDAPYYNACPLYRGERCVTGCVATAMAMILKYYEYPVKGKGTHSYKTPNGIECSFDYGNTTFDWNNMLPQYSGTYTAEQADAVAQLMLACGVAVDMQYSPSSSGAYSYQVGQALIDYFGYDGNLGLAYRQYFTSAEWMNLIKSEINEKRPIYYFGSSDDGGHAFVFDGYDAQDMVHVNWGWSGINNGYFEVSSLNPSSPGIGGGSNLGGGFTQGQAMYLGLQPPSASSTYTSHFSLAKLQTNKKEFSKGESFTLTATEIYNMNLLFKGGSLGLIVEKDGKQSVLWSRELESIETYYGYGRISISNVTIPNDFANGTYAMYLATQDIRESTWSRVRGDYGSETQFTLVVTDDRCTLTPFTGNLMIGEELDGRLEILHNLYSGRRADFRVLLSNSSPTDEFYGDAGVLFATADGNYTIVGLVGATQLELKPGTDNRDISISTDLVYKRGDVSTEIPVGDYYICPYVQWGGSVYNISGEWIAVTVGRALGSPTLVIDNVRLENSQLQVGEKLKLLADLSLGGTGNVYDGTLRAAIFAVGQGTTSNLHYANVFVEEGRPYDFELEIDPQIGEGSYTINLYKQNLLGGYDNTPVSRLNFSVGPVTGIEDEIADKDGIIIVRQPVEDILSIHTSHAARMISIYNLSGQQMMMQKEFEDKKEYSISVKGLATGYYIVILQSVDGKTYRSKFIKK